MNLNLINKEFEKLTKIEDYINYKFEPRCKVRNRGKRHIYFSDLKIDFTDEINAYGFSPYIQETYSNQKRDKNIMSYKTNFINQGLINYVKKKNKEITETEKIKVRPLSKQEFNTSFRKNSIKTNSINIDKKQEKDENFLKKALENLARNKLNLSSEEFKFEEDEEQESYDTNSLRKSQINKINKKKSIYSKSTGIEIKSNPKLSVQKQNSSYIPKLNYTNYFNNLKPNCDKPNRNKINKLVRLVNINHIEDYEKKENNFNKELIEENKKLEIKINNNKENPEIKLITRMQTINLNLKKRGNSSNVFKKLFNLSGNKNINSTSKIIFEEKKNEEIGQIELENELDDLNLAIKIFSQNTKEKERKFKESEKKIFKSRNSLLRKFTLI